MRSTQQHVDHTVALQAAQQAGLLGRGTCRLLLTCWLAMRPMMRSAASLLSPICSRTFSSSARFSAVNRPSASDYNSSTHA